MSIAFQNLFTAPPPRFNPILKSPNSFPPITFLFSNSEVLHSRARNFLNFKSPHLSSHFLLKAYESGSSIATSPESLVLGGIWRSAMVCGVVGLVGAVAIGAWTRKRQWRRICLETVKGSGGGKNFNLVERIEKLEEDLRSSVTSIQVLSKQIEKLGIRFRVTRKSSKKRIAETAGLAQRNSEATRALAVQEDILEKERGEIQKVLLAMQEQQQKQLELILAIGKSAKLFEDKRESSQEKDTVEARNLTEVEQQMEMSQTQPSGTRKRSGNDRA